VAEPTTDYYPVIDAGVLRLRHPVSWQPVQQERADFALAAPEAGRGTFRANAVIRSEATDATVQQLSTWSIASAMADLPNAYMVAVNLWDPAAVPARSLEFTYEAEGRCIYVNKYVFAASGRAIELTFSCTVPQLCSYAKLFSFMASSVEIKPEITGGR
jgi:hypothetical protein